MSVVDGFTSGSPSQALETTSSLEGLQSEEQRHVLNTIDQLRKCGLESSLSLPQLVVCGDQSAGKSSVLEALTEIPFPRKDNLCTRYATEIILRRAPIGALKIKVIPDDNRPPTERSTIEAFRESISDFAELPRLMDKATDLMGINNASTPTSRGIARDVLSIEIEGPLRPQLSLVDLPGLVQTETKGVTEEDVQLVTEITDHYISQPRTICLAVVSAANDYANQGILKKVRKVDPQGDRTLGIITKPDRLPSGSGSEKGFIGLAKNEDIFFKLGWHVLRNRSYEEDSSSFTQRNHTEMHYFRTSNFSILSKENFGIASLRDRLSQLLFAHVKQELPKLRTDLEEALKSSQLLHEAMGNRRATPQECKAFLTQLSLEFYEVSKAAVNGNYEGNYFTQDTDLAFSIQSSATIRRLRAVIQHKNSQFAVVLRKHGHKYHIGEHKAVNADDEEIEAKDTDSEEFESDIASRILDQDSVPPIPMSRPEAMRWVKEALVRTRGRELPGNFNPLLVGELFWKQSSKWQGMAENHIEDISDICNQFLDALLREKCPSDIYARLWPSKIEDALKLRFEDAISEMKKIMEDIKGYPITYNHYYTDTITKRRRKREEKLLSDCIDDTTEEVQHKGCYTGHKIAQIDPVKAARAYHGEINPNMEHHGCEEALDCLHSIYKVSPPPHPLLIPPPPFISPPRRPLTNPPPLLHPALPKNLHRQHHHASSRAAHSARAREDLLPHRGQQHARRGGGGHRLGTRLGASAARAAGAQD